MSEYDPNNVIGDFAERTKKNLLAIEAIVGDRQNGGSQFDVFEATQLVNSVLGLLIFPQQGWFNDLPKTSLADLEKQGWPKLSPKKNLVRCQTLDQLVRYLRNAIAHFNVKFIGTDGDISGLILWNHEGGRATNPRNFEIELSLVELRELLLRFADELIAIQNNKTI